MVATQEVSIYVPPFFFVSMETMFYHHFVFLALLSSHLTTGSALFFGKMGPNAS
jgi:hypothetical protein